MLNTSHSLMLVQVTINRRSSYLSKFSHPFDRYGYICLPFGVTLAGIMFQKNIDEVLSGMPTVSGIAEDTL